MFLHIKAMRNNNDRHQFACMICGDELVYDTKSNDYECMYCHEVQQSQIYCPNGHFVCDECHSSDAIGLLQMMLVHETETNPIEIVEKAFVHQSFSFHGPEHHSFVPTAILIALKNRNVARSDGESITDEIILEGIRRGSKIPGGFCGYAEACGACVGVGVAIALFTGSTPKK